MRFPVRSLSPESVSRFVVVLLPMWMATATHYDDTQPAVPAPTNRKARQRPRITTGRLGRIDAPKGQNLMDIVAQPGDPRIVEIEQLAIDEGLPLALRPETICALEDCGWMADPFTAQIWPDWSQDQAMPVATLLFLAELEAAADEVRHGRA
jgi:hypothetical protein